MKVTAIILAGGKNRRFGRSKLLETIGGKNLLECAIERLRPLADRILIVTAQEQQGLPIISHAEIIADLYPGKGPLGGIYTGLLAAQSSHCVVVACDMPFLSTELLRYMIELSPGFDAVIPRLEEGMREPLHAVYSRNCLGIMKTQLEHDQLEVYSILDLLRVRYVELVECQRLDPQLLSFFNINYPSDMDKAVALAAKGRC
ncbi:MAG: molybdenum cofactor guanylyltransferase [Chloroflexi bacterium]|nr:molybdenum cofactor guanylyltransferase [Chloroflexota bacterium]MBI2979422.1 molybdenum cofactor guanylyltransferase [Chloroflexota bacterium]